MLWWWASCEIMWEKVMIWMWSWSFQNIKMSTWEDLVVNEPHLSSLPPALASSLLKELQGARGVTKVKSKAQRYLILLDASSISMSNDRNLSTGQGPCKEGSQLSSIRRRRWLHPSFYFSSGRSRPLYFRLAKDVNRCLYGRTQSK